MIEGIAIEYEPVEDRIYVEVRAIKAEAKVAARLALTRKMAITLVRSIRELLKDEGVPGEAPRTKGGLRGAPAQGEGARVPSTGAQLVVRVGGTLRKGGQQVLLTFDLIKGSRVSLALTPRATQDLAVVMRSAVESAGWLADRQTQPTVSATLH